MQNGPLYWKRKSQLSTMIVSRSRKTMRSLGGNRLIFPHQPGNSDSRMHSNLNGTVVLRSSALKRFSTYSSPYLFPTRSVTILLTTDVPLHPHRLFLPVEKAVNEHLNRLGVAGKRGPLAVKLGVGQ